jgi:hypothetical protein
MPHTTPPSDHPLRARTGLCTKQGPSWLNVLCAQPVLAQIAHQSPRLLPRCCRAWSLGDWSNTAWASQELPCKPHTTPPSAPSCRIQGCVPSRGRRGLCVVCADGVLCVQMVLLLQLLRPIFVLRRAYPRPIAAPRVLLPAVFSFLSCSGQTRVVCTRNRLLLLLKYSPEWIMDPRLKTNTAHPDAVIAGGWSVVHIYRYLPRCATILLPVSWPQRPASTSPQHPPPSACAMLATTCTCAGYSALSHSSLRTRYCRSVTGAHRSS